VSSLILITYLDSSFARKDEGRFMIAVALELRWIEKSGLEPEGFL
jgi:hypothetical protein